MSVEAVMALLRDSTTRDNFRALHAHACGYAWGDAAAYRDDEYEQIDDPEVRAQHLWARAVENREVSKQSCHWFREAFDDIAMGRQDEWGLSRYVEISKANGVLVRDVYRIVVSRFPMPTILHPDDLRDAFAKHMMIEPEEFNAGYDLFLSIVEAAIVDKVVEVKTADRYKHRIGELAAELRGARRDAGISNPLEFCQQCEGGDILWRGDNGFELKLIVQRVDDTPKYCRHALRLSGKAADHAWTALERELGVVLNALLGSMCDMYCLPLPWLALLSVEKETVAASLDAYYCAPTKRDTILGRIRNAVILNTESAQMPHDGLALAVCMSAIEALLGKKGTDISRTMAEHIATLLEPDSRERPNAVRFVKKLYDERSRILHGEKVFGERALRDQARILFTAVLKAIVERSNFLRRVGVDMETPDGLFAELSDSKFGAGQLAGVSDSVGRRLWRPTPAGPVPPNLSAD